MLARQDTSHPAPAQPRRPFFRALAFFRKDTVLIIALVGLVAVSLATSLLQAWPIGIALDLVLNPSGKRTFLHHAALAILPASKSGQLIGLALIALGLKLAQESVWLARAMINNRLRLNGLLRTRTALYDKLQSLSLDYHRTRPQGDAIYRLSKDVLGIFGILNTTIGAAIACATIFVVIAAMLSQHVTLTLLALSVAPFLIALNVRFARTIKNRTDEFKRAETDLTTDIQRSVGAISLIQAFSRQARELTRFRSVVQHTNQTDWNVNWQEQLYLLCVQSCLGLGLAIVFACGGMAVLSGTLTCAGLLAFVDYIPKLWDPLGRLTGFRAAIQSDLVAVERVCSVLDTPISIADAPHAAPLAVAARTLHLNAVHFAYAAPETVEPRKVLRGLTATIRPGNFVAFIGPSGTGKSTLLSLLGRFYDPTAGSLTLDGHDIRSVRLADVRNHVALVPQDAAVFPGTISDNIAYGRPDATFDEIARAAEDAGAATFIAELPNGYDTPVAEAGANLSGGQRQRLAIARALLTGAPILVLDEPTSALDPASANLVFDTLSRLRGKRTIILVTHNIHSVAAADHIYVLSAGHIAEHGTHADLLAKRGAYHAMLTSEEDRVIEAA